MKSSFFVIIFTILFIILSLFNHDNINEFSYNYLDKFNTIEENVKDENWSKASDLLKTSKDNLEDENIIYYKALSAVGDLDTVDDIVTFTINNGQENISVGDYYIPVIETITVTDSEVV